MPSATLAPPPSGHLRESPAMSEDQVPLQPISESESSDAIALRSALSILQIQRQQSLRDLITLERQKLEAVADPETFTRNVLAGNIRSASNDGVLGQGQDVRRAWDQHQSANGDGESDKSNSNVGRPSSVDTIPSPQNIVRCPPVNWAKYHIVGDALDNLHEQQRSHPAPGQPRTDQDATRPPEHVIAAPYRPWADKLPESSMRTRSGAKNDL
ncbi:MAG: hypothetical protein Q9187_008023 [Circinaria calcarea]